MTVILAIGVPRMGKTQALLDYVGAHASTHLFFTTDRSEDWTRDSRDEAGKARWRGVRWRDWTAQSARLQALIGGASMSERPWFCDAPAPDDVREGWLDELPPFGVVRFGWPWEGLDVAQAAKDKGNVSLVDDELDFTALMAGWTDNPLRDFVQRGRHLPNAKGEVGKVHLLGAMRRPQSTHIDVTTLADEVFVFRVKGSRTWKRLVDDRILEESEVEEVAELEPYTYKLWRASGDSAWGKLAPL